MLGLSDATMVHFTVGRRAASLRLAAPGCLDQAQHDSRRLAFRGPAC
jgi:hypothetical protein